MLKNIKVARLQANLTQRQMSELLLIPQRTIENWEMGIRKPPLWAEKLIIEKLQQVAKEKTQ